MKAKPRNYIHVLCGVLACVIFAGCAQQQQQKGRYQPAPMAAKAPEPMAKPGYGPSYTKYQEDGATWIRGSMAFPTGLRDSSGLLVEKSVPEAVLAGQKFSYLYKVSNLTDYPIQMVTLTDRVTPNFVAAEADPKPTSLQNGVATWDLETLGPKESKTIRITGASAEEGSVDTCGWATYSPILCEEIQVLKAGIQLTKSAPAEALICDNIPMKLVVKNSGSSTLTGVRVADTLPEGLLSEGKSSLSFDVGNLAPGESKEVAFNATASKTGKFVNTAKATASQGVSADASATTIVHQPVLNIMCQAPDERYMGRPFEVQFTVVNTGDAPAAGTVVQVPIPTGLTFRSATAEGRVVDNRVVWDVGSLAVNTEKVLGVSFVSSTGGNFQFNAMAKGTCAKEVETACETRVVGVAGILLEKADDPDPVGVGETTTYTVKITNQGSADDQNVRMVVTIAPELTPVSATGEGAISGQTVTFPAVPKLAPKESVTYKIVAKGAKAGDGRTRFELNSNMLKTPVIAEESTHVY